MTDTGVVQRVPVSVPAATPGAAAGSAVAATKLRAAVKNRPPAAGLDLGNTGGLGPAAKLLTERRARPHGAMRRFSTWTAPS